MEGTVGIFRADSCPDRGHAAGDWGRHFHQRDAAGQWMGKQDRNHGKQRRGEAGGARELHQPRVFSGAAHSTRAGAHVGPG